jgi:hypothetical protein
MKRILFVGSLLGSLYAEESFFYKKSNLHAFLPKANDTQVSIAFQKVNETIDIFNIKESEFSSSSKNFDTLGDMEGIGLELGYAFDNKWYLNLDLNQKDMQYSSTTLTNKNLDIYLRHQVYQENNRAFAVDIGYETNRASDTYMRNLDVINKGIKNIFGYDNIRVTQKDEVYNLVASTGQTLQLENKPYISIINTKDDSFYTRLIGSFKKEHWLFDTYVGYTKTKIRNETGSSIWQEENSLLQQTLKNVDLVQKRTDDMLFLGFGIIYQINRNWYSELNYQYNRIFRDKGLNETNMNHIFDLNLIYELNDDASIFIGGKLMSNQFNGEIPYLYGEYTDTSFDHKYGFANIGIIYNF